jgi:hypothetical protein
MKLLTTFVTDENIVIHFNPAHIISVMWSSTKTSRLTLSTGVEVEVVGNHDHIRAQLMGEVD